MMNNKVNICNEYTQKCKNVIQKTGTEPVYIYKAICTEEQTGILFTQVNLLKQLSLLFKIEVVQIVEFF